MEKRSLTPSPERKMKAGDKIKFHAKRILKGNPVKAIFLREDEEWIYTRLLKDIEGVSTLWEEGEEKPFRKSLIGTITALSASDQPKPSGDE